MDIISKDKPAFAIFLENKIKNDAKRRIIKNACDQTLLLMW